MTLFAAKFGTGGLVEELATTPEEILDGTFAYLLDLAGTPPGLELFEGDSSLFPIDIGLSAFRLFSLRSDGLNSSFEACLFIIFGA